MMIHRLAVIAVVGFALRASAANPGAADWQASKSRAIAYLDAYEKQMTGYPAELENSKEARRLAASVENSEKSLNAQAKSMLVLDEPDEQRRSERATASEALTNLRLVHLYGNLIPRILNDFDTAFARQRNTPRLFPVRPIEITHEDFLKKQVALVAQVCLVEILDDPSH